MRIRKLPVMLPMLGLLAAPGTQAPAPAAMADPPAALVALANDAYDAAYSLDHDIARRLARRAVSEYPGEPVAHRTLASVLWLEIMFLRGAVTVDHYMGGLNKSKDRLPPIPADMHEEFRTALATAKSLAEARLDDDDDDLRARYDLGAAYAIEATYKASIEGSDTAAFGAARRAYDAQDKVLQRVPDYGRAAVVVGTYRYMVSTMSFPKRWFVYLFGMRGNKDLGISLIRASVSDDRAYVNAQLALLLILTREERYDEAFEAARALMEAMPRNRLFVLEAGAAATRAKQLEEAERLLSDGLAAYRRDPRPKAPGEAAFWYYKRGAARLLDERLEAAGDDLAIALESEPIEWLRGRIHLELGKLADLEGRRPDALAAYRLAREIADDNDDSMGENQARRWLSRPFSLLGSSEGTGGTATSTPMVAGGYQATPEPPTP